MKIRESTIDTLTRLYRENANSNVYNVDNEEWTLKKVLDVSSGTTGFTEKP